MTILLPETHEAWLQERKRGIGASDAGTIIGVNNWKSNQELYREKVGLVEPEDISDKPQVQLGHDEEPLIRALFALENPEYEVAYESPYKMIFHDIHDFLFCTPDGELTERSTGRKGLLEIKTTEIKRSEQWKEWDNKIPQTYYAQVCHQLLCTGWDFVVLKTRIRYYKDGELRIAEKQYTIERDEAAADMEYLLEKEIEFWECVKARKQPGLILPNI